MSWIGQNVNVPAIRALSASLVDTELVSSFIDNFNLDKGDDLDGFVAEHLHNCHPIN
jgi:hypothetical protein